MRQKEREITDRAKLDQIISGALYCHLACSIDDQPYLVPLSFGYDGRYIYFHTAHKGKKSDIFSQNSNVCVSFEREVSLKQDNNQACNWSFQFQSVLVSGIIEEVITPEGRTEALNQIMAQYSHQKWPFQEKTVTKTSLWRVNPKTITGKQSPAR